MRATRCLTLDLISSLRGAAGRQILAMLILAAVSGCGGGGARAEGATGTGEPVVVLHGLARSSASMGRMARSLEAAGFNVCNVAYPSRRHAIAILATDFVAPEISRCFPAGNIPIHFVTHSVGGIVVRDLAASGAFQNFGRVVMLSPPNQGSEVVDKLGHLWLFKAINGPAGAELGTGPDAVPQQLGPAPFEVGVITGTRTINPFLSMLIPGSDDGKVAVERARLEGMRDFLVVEASHPFIMNNRTAIAQTIHFLRFGSFARRSGK